MSCAHRFTIQQHTAFGTRDLCQTCLSTRVGRGGVWESVEEREARLDAESKALQEPPAP